MERIESEQQFHDHAFEHQSRAVVDKFYAITRKSTMFYQSLLDQIESGSNVLEYGCGEGSSAFSLAERTNVVGIDISPVGVEHARNEAKRQGLLTATFEVMNAEELAFADRSFDAVCGTGILHHLDLSRALPEIARVLRGGGQGIFVEPLGHNPAINMYRRRTPDIRTVDEHPLLMNDLQGARRVFRSVDVHFFHLLTLLAVPLRSTLLFLPTLKALERVDQALLSAVPLLDRYAWICVIRLGM